MKKPFYLICILLLISCSAEIKHEDLVVRDGITYEVNSSEPFSGEAVKYYTNLELVDKKGSKSKELGFTQTIKERVNYKNGIKHGLFESFYGNGQLKSKLLYADCGIQGLREEYSENGKLISLINTKEIYMVILETTLGSIEIELFRSDAPITTQNFMDYVNEGYYDGTIFHRVIPGFVIQGGGLEPGMRNKPGNPPIENEANNCQKNLKWSLSMARTSDPHSATSQFFINLENNSSLDYKSETPQGWGYAVFGTVIDGFDVVEKISSVSTGSSDNHQDVPLEDIVIKRAKVTKE